MRTSCIRSWNAPESDSQGSGLMRACFDFDARYDVAVMGPMEWVRFGEQLFKRYQVEAHKIFCPKEAGDKQDIDNLKKP